MAKHKLTDLKVRNAKTRETPYRLADGGNLYLFVTPTGVRSWQLRYRFQDRPQTATLGKWPAMSLAEARDEAEKKRTLAVRGEHLTQVKHAAKLKRSADRANTFEKVAADWVQREARRQQWTPNYRGEVAASLRNHLPKLNRLPLTEINASVVAPQLRSIENKAPHMLEKVRRRLNAILDYGVEHGLIVGNPLPAVKRSRKYERRHFPAVTDLRAVGEIMREARASDPCKGVQRAHLLLAFTAMRVSEVVGAKWVEFELSGSHVPVLHGLETKFDPNTGNWTIPRERMKQHKNAERGPHIVPLPPALLAALREWRAADDSSAVYVCPAPRDASKPITAEAIEKHYRRTLELAGKHSPHSWRSTFSTICRDAGKDDEVIEAQLDHVVGNKVAAAYDRAKRLELRRELMRWYEATLLAARDGATVVSIRA
jgi:integrase